MSTQSSTTESGQTIDYPQKVHHISELTYSPLRNINEILSAKTDK